MARVSTGFFSFLIFIYLIGPFGSLALGQHKETLTIDDYRIWRSIGSTSISHKGDWISYAYRQMEKDPELHLVHLESKQKHKILKGSNPVFSSDSQFAVYTLNPPAKGNSPAKSSKGSAPSAPTSDASKESSKRSTVLLDLKSGKKWTWNNITSRQFNKDSSVLILKKRKGSGTQKHSGSDLLIHNLKNHRSELVGNVDLFSINKPGTHLAYTISADGRNGNGLYLLEFATGKRQILDQDDFDYSRLTWSEKGKAIAILKGKEKKGYSYRPNSLSAFVGIGESKIESYHFSDSQAFKFPKNYVISELASLSWSQDLSRVFFGIKKQEKKTKKKNSKPVANVDIWHWKDDRIQSVQMLSAARDRRYTDRAVYDLQKKKFTRLTDKKMRSITVSRNGKWGIGRSDQAYISDWKERKADYYRVDIFSGKRKLILKGHRRTMGMSPASTHYLFWKDAHIWAYDLEKDSLKNLTEKAPVSFANAQYDHPGEVPPYGVAGWSKDGKSIILNHRYDLWQQPLDGSKATSLTLEEGKKKEIRLRYIKTDRESRFIDLTKPILLSAYGQWTKKSGFYRLEKGKLNSLLFEDKRFSRLMKAKSAEKFLFTSETFSEFPDYYTCDGNFKSLRRMTDANPQQVNYLWGHRILFDYTNTKGVRLQGTLAIPEDYRKGEKLPMLVQYYEKNSQNLHRYPAPRYRSGPEFAGYVSNRYLVMQPDIHFNTRTSHADMLECIEAAVKKVIKMGYVDPKRIGLHGHSYSGQGSAYISTRTKTFSAIVAGAAATNLVSDFNQLWKSAGTNQHRYDIYGQGRFGTNPFDDPKLYREQSAVHQARNMDTPLLLLHGTNDGSVEWLQAVEFYNALRFNGKNVILLSYPGEGHGLRKQENQIDFQKRMRAFFDHHLKGSAAPAWMTRGVPFLQKKK